MIMNGEAAHCDAHLDITLIIYCWETLLVNFTAVIIRTSKEKYKKDSLLCDTRTQNVKVEIKPHECKQITYLT